MKSHLPSAHISTILAPLDPTKSKREGKDTLRQMLLHQGSSKRLILLPSLTNKE